MTELLQFTLFGLMLGCIYAIAAMGLVLTYTVTGVFNFSHGAIGMICAFAYYELRVEHGWPTPLAIGVVVLVLAPVLGLLVERILRAFQGSDGTTSLVVTIALTIALLGAAQKAFDPRVARNVPYLFGDHRITIATVPITYDRIAEVVIAIAIAFGLRFLLFRTSLGAHMRAVVDDPELARLNGVRADAVARRSWIIGFMLAAVGGVLFAGGQNLGAVVLTFLVLNAYAAAMIGRLRSLPMTFVGALLLGFCQEITNVSWLWPAGDTFARLKLAIPGLFLIVAVALIPSLRLAAGRVVGRDQPAVPTVRRAAIGAAGMIIAVAALAAVLPDQYDVHVVRAVVMSVVALSLVALTGLSGQLSLVQYLFLGVGAFVSGSYFGNGTVLGMLLAGLVCAVLGALVALPAVRLKGLHLALATFGVALAGREALIGDPRVFGLGGLGVHRPTVLGLSARSDAAFAVWAAVVFSLLALGLVVLRRSWMGRQLTAIRDSEMAAAMVGISVRTSKVLNFALSAFIAGCAGALFGGLQGAVDAGQFDPVNGLVIVLFVFVGGVTSISGAVVAGSLFALLAYVQHALPDLAGVIFIVIGGAAIGLGRQPNGIVGIVTERFRRRPSPTSEPEPEPEPRLSSVGATA